MKYNRYTKNQGNKKKYKEILNGIEKMKTT